MVSVDVKKHLEKGLPRLRHTASTFRPLSLLTQAREVGRPRAVHAVCDKSTAETISLLSLPVGLHVLRTTVTHCGNSVSVTVTYCDVITIRLSL